MQSSFVRLSTGVQLHYVERGDPSGPPLVFLHGYTDSWFSFSLMLESLPMRYHAYVLDQRGHGDSSRPASGYSMSDFAADVGAFMDATGLDQIAVIGHSMGSLVAQQLALEQPHRIERLALIGSAAHMRSEDTLELQKMVATLEDPVPEPFVRDFQTSTIHRPVEEEFLDRIVSESLKVPAGVWRAALEGQLAVDNSGRLHRIQIPTMLVHGDHDVIFSRAARDTLVAGLPQAIEKVYRDTGHALHWERPLEVVRDLDDFLMSTPLSRPR